MAGPFAQGGTPIARVQHLGQSRRLCGLVAIGLAVLPTLLQAGAWVPPPKQGVVIANLAEIDTLEGPDGASFELYGEYGLRPKWALVVAPSWSKAVQSQSTKWVVDEVLIGARRKLHLTKSVAISTQIAGFSIPGTSNQSQRTYGLETRLAMGKNFGDRAWLNVEAASRSCGDAGLGSRFDVTLGLNFREGQRVLLKTFGDGTGCTQSIVRGQISYVRPLSQKVSVEIGWRQTLGQDTPLSDRGLVIGLWQRF